MDIASLVARLLLALVFGAAGTAKAIDPAGTRRGLIGFGVPEKLAIPLTWCLPPAEILVALALMPISTAWFGAIAALVMLLIFTLAVGANLILGRKPECNCFGQLHSKPLSWYVFARDLLLAGIAVFVLGQEEDGVGIGAFDWLVDLKAGEIAGVALSLVAVCLLGITVAYVRRVAGQLSTLLAKIEAMKKVIDEDYAEPPVQREDAAGPLEGLPVGAPAPNFSLPAIGGGPQVALGDLLAGGKSVLLLFVTPNCSPCTTVLEAVKRWEREYRKQLTIAVLTKGDLKQNHDRVVEYGATHLLLQGESTVAEEYEAKWTPAAVIVNRDGRIASPVAYGAEMIQSLVTRAGSPFKVIVSVDNGANGNGHRPPIRIGTPHSHVDVGKPAPSFSLLNADDELISREDLLGKDTLLLFWDPKCPFCQAMSTDIQKWEEDPPPGAPRLVFISSGDAVSVRAERSRFRSQILYDSGMAVGLQFGTNLTPSAVLIDAKGNIASAPEAGRANILTLAGVRRPTPVAFSA